MSSGTAAVRYGVGFLGMLAGQAAGQCGNPALFELGGRAAAICPATIGTQVNYEAVGRGRFVSIESSPLTAGGPSVYGRVGLDAQVVAMHTEIIGRVWATDGMTVYGLDTNNYLNPILLGRITLETAPSIKRIRVRGSYVYAIGPSGLSIIDVSNPAAPVLRSTTPISGASINDVEVVGSYAYLAISEATIPAVNSMQVLDISNPTAPVLVRRVGNSGRNGLRLWKAASSSVLYAFARNSAAGALELWSLSSPSNPTLSAVNATISFASSSEFDELRVTSAAACYFQQSTGLLRLYSTGTLASIGSPIALRTGTLLSAFGTDTPHAYVTRDNGEVARININTSPPTVNEPYYEQAPGYSQRVMTTNEGYSVLLGLQDFWCFSTPPGATPTLASHIRADPGWSFIEHGAALLPGGSLFITEYQSGQFPVSRVLIYRVTGGTSPVVQIQNSFDVSGLLDALTVGFDGGGVARLYYTTGSVPGPAVLRVMDVSTLTSVSQTGSFGLTAGVSWPLLFLPAGGSQPARVLVGGAANKVQVVSVASAANPASLGIIPSSCRSMAGGAAPIVWVTDGPFLKAYDISAPAVPALRSSTRFSLYGWARDTKVVNASGSQLAISTDQGDLVMVSAANPAAPGITQISSNVAADMAFDGTNIHMAVGTLGYRAVPVSFNAPPRESPNASLYFQGTQGIVGICSGSPVTMTATFAANPPVTAYQWLRYNPTTQAYQPLADGPTGTGSSASGTGTATLVISSPGAADAGFYRCRATNACGTAVTDGVVEARLGGYANCDQSTVAPVINVLDFACFLNRFAGGYGLVNEYANCDGSSALPALNVLDFACFLNKFAAGCQ